MFVPMFTKIMALKKTSLMYVCMRELKCHETLCVGRKARFHVANAFLNRLELI